MTKIPYDEHYCRKCKEDVAVDHANRCAWCGGPVRRQPRRMDKSGGKFLKCITEQQLEQIRDRHIAGESFRRLTRVVFYPHTTYASPGAAEKSIRDAFQHRGWPIRSRRAATRLANTKHGMAARHLKGTAINRAYNKAYNAKRKADREPDCIGTTLDDTPCTKPSLIGSDYCVIHDPVRGEVWRAAVAESNRKRSEAKGRAA